MMQGMCLVLKRVCAANLPWKISLMNKVKIAPNQVLLSAVDL
jgi:hypothetical protein